MSASSPGTHCVQSIHSTAYETIRFMPVGIILDKVAFSGWLVS
jgi:hypothetical protein